MALKIYQWLQRDGPNPNPMPLPVIGMELCRNRPALGLGIQEYGLDRTDGGFMPSSAQIDALVAAIPSSWYGWALDIESLAFGPSHFWGKFIPYPDEAFILAFRKTAVLLRTIRDRLRRAGRWGTKVGLYNWPWKLSAVGRRSVPAALVRRWRMLRYRAEAEIGNYPAFGLITADLEPKDTFASWLKHVACMLGQRPRSLREQILVLRPWRQDKTPTAPSMFREMLSACAAFAEAGMLEGVLFSAGAADRFDEHNPYWQMVMGACG